MKLLLQKMRMNVLHLIFILTAANLITTSTVISVVNYVSQLSSENQKALLDLVSKAGKELNATVRLVNLQGNLSVQQRGQLLNEFTSVQKEGGFATKAGQAGILHQINQTNNEILALLKNRTH
jgi:hypothetical protein